MSDEVRQAWRDQVIEEAIDPDLAIIDSHHHLFSVAHRPLLEPYMPDDLFADMRNSGHRIVATVHVDGFANYRTTGPDNLRVVGETEYIDSVANRALGEGGAVAGACATIVGNAELLLGEAVGEVLDAHLAASHRFKGVRRMTVSDPDLPPTLPGLRDPGILAQPEFRKGLAEVTRRNLSFDAAVVHPQIPEVVDLARAVPQAKIILNNLGTPLGIGRFANRRAEVFAQWHHAMADLASCPNVTVKIGGLNMAFTGLGVGNAPKPPTSLELAQLQGDFVCATIDLFGPDRCMFESNFPIDQWYTSYTILWNAFKRMASRYTAEERHSLFCETACRVYQIDVPQTTLDDQQQGKHL